MLEKDWNGSPISTFPPCYAFQMTFTELAPRLIQSISHKVHHKNRALKQLCCGSRQYAIKFFASVVNRPGVAGAVLQTPLSLII